MLPQPIRPDGPDDQRALRRAVGGGDPRLVVPRAAWPDAQREIVPRLTQLGGWFADYNTQAPHGPGLPEPGGVPGDSHTVPSSV